MQRLIANFQRGKSALFLARRRRAIMPAALQRPVVRTAHLNSALLASTLDHRVVHDPTKVDVSKSESSVVRSAMMEYWKSWENTATESGTHFENMVGERSFTRALEMAELDQREVFSLLPDMNGMTVLELAAGVGRLTGELAKRVKHLTATDFLEAYVRENEMTNSPKYSNVNFRVLDATQLDYPPNSFDCVFSYWLLMYLGDLEMRTFAQNILKVIRPNGHLFFRESHFLPLGPPKPNNPTVYRNLKEYFDCFSTVTYTNEDNETFFFDLVFSGNSKTYIQQKNNPTQIYWLWKKTKLTNSPSTVDIQTQLDRSQYSKQNIRVMEETFGNGFTSPGGLQVTKELVSKLPLQSGSQVLDVGSGLGGTVEYMAKECEADATGLELSVLASQSAVLRMNAHSLNRGHLRIGDVRRIKFAPGSFEAVFARDTLQQFSNKNGLLDKFFLWLKPGGQLLLGDYCLTEKGLSTSLAKFMKDEQLQLIEAEVYIRMLENSGYTDIKLEDWSDRYLYHLQQSLARLRKDTMDVTSYCLSEKLKSLFSGLQHGELTWSNILAKKPERW